ncbi:MAG: choice-of-anchor I family protein, partial [Limisphaerales bacterium]
YASGQYGVAAAEIVAHDPATQRLLVVNAQAATVDVLDISDPTQPTKIGQIDLLLYGGVANSVAVRDGLLAVAVENVAKTDAGQVVFFDRNFRFINSVTVGALPDMVAFSPNGRWLLVANEGEPNRYNDPSSVDPEGSISIIDLSRGAMGLTQQNVRTARFTAFDGMELDPSIRIFGPNASVSQDLEPEYIAISQDSKQAWVTLQENNALAVIDIPSATVTELIGLGFKDHSLPGNGLDASDRDNAINIRNWPLQGMYLPDSISAFQSRGQTFLVMANEGDARDWPGFAEEARVAEARIILDPIEFPNAAELKENKNLGRLRVTSATGDVDGDGDFDALHSFGGRSFTIRDAAGNIVFDSGDQLERLTAAVLPDFFNAGHDNNTKENRSPTKGPEPEGLTVGKAYGRTYAFVGLERIGGIVSYDITNPYQPVLVDYINNRDFGFVFNSGLAGDLGPEGLLFINAEDSPTGTPLLAVGNEVSGTTTLYAIEKTR